MKQQNINIFKKSALCIALSSTFAVPVYAFEEAEKKVSGIERIEVTASRRSSSVQEAPLNITALDADVMKEHNIGKLTDIARFVPGLSIPDQGGRGGNNIIVRGLNTNSSGPGSDGGTVATYFGEQPLAVDVRLIDVERVEVLIGPQGTLYGAGTLGGAIRYMPKKAALDETTIELSGDGFKGSESASFGGESSFIFNTPLIEDTLAVRASVNFYNDPGFIDYNYIVKEGGVSNPENKADLRKIEDANGQDVFTGRLALRWTPTEDIDATLTYLYQKTEDEGRSITNYQSLGPTNPLRDEIGKYENAARYDEPQENEDSLISLDLNVDLGFAELVSSTGFSENEGFGQRDQTDLLIANPWSYETFPTFSAFTREDQVSDSFTQEIRLVSQSDSALSWIAGAYYNKATNESTSKEYTPGFAAFSGADRPDDLEYLQYNDGESVEKAIFGELSYQATEALSLTIGARFYEYDLSAANESTSPFFQDELTAGNTSTTFKPGVVKTFTSEGDGNLFKFNANYRFSDDIMAYATLSEGFRLGGTNGIKPCEVPLPAGQNLCALPSEASYIPDTTTNYELGFKSTWLNNKFHFNAALFTVDWADAQVSGATTKNGGLPYTTNAGSANSTGVELMSRAMLSDNIIAFATYSYAKAELTADAVNLFGAASTPAAQVEYSAFDGDRLSGSPEQQFSMGINYTQDIFNDKVLDVVYGMTYQSDTITRVGLRAEGETLPGYALSNLSATISADEWSVTLYVDNMFDKYAFTSTRGSTTSTGIAEFPSEIQNTATVGKVRSYGHYVTAPRTIGLKFNYLFDM